METIERRVLMDSPNTQTEVPDASEVPSEPKGIKGTAALYDVVYDVLAPDGSLAYREVMRDGCFSTVKGADVFCLWQHDRTKPLGRTSAGTLGVWTDQKGLQYEVKDVGTAGYRSEAMEAIKRKEVCGSSLTYGVKKGADKWTKQTDGSLLREILTCSVYDVSPVSVPANSQTSVSARSQTLTETELREVFQHIPQEEEKPADDTPASVLNALEIERKKTLLSIQTKEIIL
jgi:HK97 family phage prohead protease